MISDSGHSSAISSSNQFSTAILDDQQTHRASQVVMLSLVVMQRLLFYTVESTAFRGCLGHWFQTLNFSAAFWMRPFGGDLN